ncbi:hypothetical protein DEO72_LG8g2142 [Vigna unguiculata]|uniref:Uncharacterized protein n=1 Tax=Vigna unguiculata TaxID=3917 RepID=A0A4D6MVI6_VIGUN|nr:hypothetical protein DEO72_LG8g2142 [Vigna unguiculata]
MAIALNPTRSVAGHRDALRFSNLFSRDPHRVWKLCHRAFCGAPTVIRAAITQPVRTPTRCFSILMLGYDDERVCDSGYGGIDDVERDWICLGLGMNLCWCVKVMA